MSQKRSFSFGVIIGYLYQHQQRSDEKMYILNAYARREALSDNELERLEAGLKDEVERYLDVICNYSPEKMAKYGRPYLAELEVRLNEVRNLISRRHATKSE